MQQTVAELNTKYGKLFARLMEDYLCQPNPKIKPSPGYAGVSLGLAKTELNASCKKAKYCQ